MWLKEWALSCGVRFRHRGTAWFDGRLASLLVIAWTFLSAPPSRAQDPGPVVLLMRPDSASVEAGQPWRATVFFLNTGPAPVRHRLPDRIPWVGGGAGASDAGAWVREVASGAAASGDVEVAAGAFVKATYQALLPDHWSSPGDRWVEVPSAQGVRFAVVVSPAGAPAVASDREPAGRGVLREGTGEMPDLSPIGPRELPGQGFFRRHFAGYEPVYFVWGPEEPNAKFQVSFRYRVMNPESDLGPWWEWAQGIHVAYTQTSLWDLNKPSAPFYDTSYKPELMWREDDLFPGQVSWWRQLGLQAGIQHESNGKDGADSRSLNIVYLRPTFVWGEVTNLFVAASPRFWVYAGDLSGNPAIKDYRGNMDLTVKGGWARGFQAAGLFRVGDGFDRGSMQVDVTFPVLRLLGDLDLLLHAQYFNGWGESLLAYDERTWIFRFGVSLFR